MSSLIASLWIACGPRASAPEHAADPAGWAERFDADEDSVIAEVAGLDPLPQELAVVDLRAARPAASAALCAALEPGRIRARCERLDPDAPPPSFAASAWLELPAELQPPPGDATSACAPADVGCLVDAARSAAMDGDSAGAADACRALPDPLLVDDCAISAAERLPPGEGQLATALRLCAAAGRFAARCHADRVAALVPSPSRPVTSERLLDGAEAVRQAWGALDPTRAPRALDLYWAMVAGDLLARLPELPAELIAGLPHPVGPHLRSARALRALTSDDPMAAALSDGPLPPAPPSALRAGWQRSPPVAPPLRRVPFDGLRGGVRPISPDPVLDQGLAVLTAAALAEPPRLELLDAVVRGDGHRVLRWAAACLLAEVAPGHPALAIAALDPEPLVRGAVVPIRSTP